MAQPEIPEINPEQAYEILQTEPEAVLLDVRTSMEYEYVGHPLGAVHVPWQEAPAWVRNPHFVEDVKQALAAARPDAADPAAVPILALCRSGKRSRAAAEALAAQGFQRVFNIAEGFEGDLDERRHRNCINGWRARGLPWEQG